MVTRREQLGTDDAALAEAKKTTPPKDAPKTRSRQKKQDAPTAPKTTPKAKASSSKSGGVEKKEKPKRKSKTENVKESEPEKVKEPENAKESEPETPKEAEPEIPKKVDGKRKKVESQGGTEKKLKTAPAAKAASKRKAEKGDEGTTDGQTKTWAGRWIPTDPVALMKFESIKTVFYEKIAPKVKAPSSLQNAFFKLVNNAFKSLAPEAKKKDYLACARKNVEKFLADESVCT